MLINIFRAMGCNVVNVKIQLNLKVDQTTFKYFVNLAVDKAIDTALNQIKHLYYVISSDLPFSGVSILVQESKVSTNLSKDEAIQILQEIQKGVAIYLIELYSTF